MTDPLAPLIAPSIADMLDALPADRPVLIAGPTASGKSALALKVVRDCGGIIVNADAMQVFDNWRVLTARPSAAEESQAPHRLYGHIGGAENYSAGQWLREVAPLLRPGLRPVIVGGTGLYFQALTEGLAEIPPIPPDIRAEGDRARLADLQRLLDTLDRDDPETARRIDRHNPMRVQRAWEVLRATGRGMAAWHRDTPPPLLPLSECCALLVTMDKAALNARIDRRLARMIDDGALDEVRSNIAARTFDSQSAKAIGAAQLRDHLTGDLTLDAALERAAIETHRYAKRQRSWFRSHMAGWQMIGQDPD